MSKPWQQEKLEAAGWECGGSHSVEVRLDDEDESRYYVRWAEKGEFTVRVVGNPAESARVWARVFQEVKKLDPTGLEDPDRSHIRIAPPPDGT